MHANQNDLSFVPIQRLFQRKEFRQRVIPSVQTLDNAKQLSSGASNTSVIGEQESEADIIGSHMDKQPLQVNYELLITSFHKGGRCPFSATLK